MPRSHSKSRSSRRADVVVDTDSLVGNSQSGYSAQRQRDNFTDTSLLGFVDAWNVVFGILALVKLTSSVTIHPVVWLVAVLAALVLSDIGSASQAGTLRHDSKLGQTPSARTNVRYLMGLFTVIGLMVLGFITVYNFVRNFHHLDRIESTSNYTSGMSQDALLIFVQHVLFVVSGVFGLMWLAIKVTALRA